MSLPEDPVQRDTRPESTEARPNVSVAANTPLGPNHGNHTMTEPSTGHTALLGANLIEGVGESGCTQLLIHMTL